MAICYDKLWKLLIDKKMNRTELKEASGISFNVLARLGKNEPVSFESIEKICFTLNCKIEDVVEIQKEEPLQIDSDAFTTIELFAGAGGLALGIEKAGFEPLGLIEFDKDAAESLKTNRPNWRVIHDDIANISCLDLEDYFGIKKGELDLLSNRTELKEASGISFNVLARLGKNEPVSFESIEKICFTLNCKIEDVVEIKKEKSPQIDSDAFTTIELFAGAGGLALGIEKAGFEPVGLIEFDKDAAESLKTNRPNWRVIHDDIANISCLDLEDYFGIKKGELDLLSGGAPCQAFSYAGKRLGLEDARGTLFYHYATFLQKLQPKMFLFENVRGLLTHDKGRTYATITNIFEQAGYTIQKKVLNAWDFGVPQKRERLITVGIRNDLVGKVSFSFPKEHDYKPVLRDVLLDCPEGPGVPYGENKRKIFELVPPGGYWRDIDPEIAKAYMKSCWDMEGGRTGILRRMSLDEPSLTVLTSPSQKQTERCHPLEARPFTVRENARCQTFPDEWQFCGSVQSQYLEVGNAVTVILAYEIGLEIHKSLEGVK